MGREQAGFRPGLVISHDRFNGLANGLHIVVPLTRTNRRLIYHVRIDPSERGLTDVSFAMCDQVKLQSVDRFIAFRGTVDDATLLRVQRVAGELIDR